MRLREIDFTRRKTHLAANLRRTQLLLPGVAKLAGLWLKLCQDQFDRDPDAFNHGLTNHDLGILDDAILVIGLIFAFGVHKSLIYWPIIALLDNNWNIGGAQNPDLDELFADYPRLTREDVQACLQYAEGLVKKAKKIRVEEGPEPAQPRL